MEMTTLEFAVLIISAINVIMPIVSMIRDREILSHFSAFAGWTSALLYEIAYLCK